MVWKMMEERLFGSGSKKFGEGVDFKLYDSAKHTVSGPKAEYLPSISTFDELCKQFGDSIPTELTNNIHKCGYSRPTPVQKLELAVGFFVRYRYLLDPDCLLISMASYTWTPRASMFH